MRAAKPRVKIFSNHFSKKKQSFKKKFDCVDFYEFWKAFLHSILIGEVKVTITHVLQALAKILNKKNFEVSS